jgi:nucleoside-diphosphate-sugar epimerase
LPDEPYGASKLAIEKILELIPGAYSMETVSLRIARVLGPGAKRTSSPWRSQIFERQRPDLDRLTIPFAPDARLSVVHVDDLARMLRTLVEVQSIPNRIYNSPVELIGADEVKRLAEEVNGWQVSMGMSHGGPEIDGTRFAKDFDFVLRSLHEHMSTPIT